MAFHGGINSVLFDEPESLYAEMKRVIPVMKQNGGYVMSSDHSIPQTVGLEDFQTFVSLARRLGSYE